MIPPNLDISSEKFDAKKFLHFRRVPLPYPKAKLYNNIAEYYSHVFLRTAAVSNKLIKKQVTRERNYEWYYDTLGLSESQRKLIQHNKKIQKRKGKKPVSIVTIPCSPLKSQRVTACKSDYKDYCRRKYRSLDSASAVMDIKPIKFGAFPSDSTSESSLLSASIDTENSAFVLPSIKLEDEILPTSLNSVETNCGSSSIRIKSEPSESLSSLHFLTTKSSTSCVVKPEPLENEDSCSDAILIRQVRSNVQRGLTLKNVYDSPDSIQIKKERTLSFNSNYGYNNAKYVRHPHPTHSKNTLSNSRPDRSSNYHSLNPSNNSSSLNETENKPSSQVEDSCATIKNQKKDVKKQNKSSGSELKSQSGQKISKPKKKPSSPLKDVLDCDQSMKSTQNVLGQKKSAADKENSSMNDSKSSIQPITKCKKSTLKSQKNVLDSEKLPATVKTNNKLKKQMSKIKMENSPVINHCTCKFPCGLSHLCTCGYYANAKEVLSKFKIPRKKK